MFHIAFLQNHPANLRKHVLAIPNGFHRGEAWCRFWHSEVEAPPLTPVEVLHGPSVVDVPLVVCMPGGVAD